MSIRFPSWIILFFVVVCFGMGNLTNIFLKLPPDCWTNGWHLVQCWLTFFSTLTASVFWSVPNSPAGHWAIGIFNFDHFNPL